MRAPDSSAQHNRAGRNSLKIGLVLDELLCATFGNLVDNLKGGSDHPASYRVLGHLVRNALERFEAVNASRIERKPRNVSVRAGPVRLDKAEAFSLIKKPFIEPVGIADFLMVAGAGVVFCRGVCR